MTWTRIVKPDRAALVAALALLVAGCSAEKTPEREAPRDEASAPASPAAMAPTASAAAENGRTSQYTKLSACKVTESSVDEGGWSVSACPGLAGYRLRLTEGDLRQDIVVMQPKGAERALDVVGATGRGGFSRIGDTVEWRGAGEGASFRPDALILRYNVVENPETPEKETSYLLTVSLADGKPCVTAKFAPGPDQNERAREKADAGGKCLA